MTAQEALKLHRSLMDGSLRIVARDVKEDLAGDVSVEDDDQDRGLAARAVMRS
jgi:hypothetical protein